MDIKQQSSPSNLFNSNVLSPLCSLSSHPFFQVLPLHGTERIVLVLPSFQSFVYTLTNFNSSVIDLPTIFHPQLLPMPSCRPGFKCSFSLWWGHRKPLEQICLFLFPIAPNFLAVPSPFQVVRGWFCVTIFGRITKSQNCVGWKRPLEIF